MTEEKIEKAHCPCCHRRVRIVAVKGGNGFVFVRHRQPSRKIAGLGQPCEGSRRYATVGDWL